jgi:hypothetical protein
VGERQKACDQKVNTFWSSLQPGSERYGLT